MKQLPAIVLVAVVLAGCGSGERVSQVPMPALDAAEALVAERIREAAEAVVRESESAAAWGRLGTVYDLNGFPAEALRCYTRAREIDPEEWRWAYFAGLILRESDPGEARELFDLASQRADGYAPLEFHRGVLAIDARDLNSARTHFDLALEQNPEFVNAILGLAHIAVADGDPTAALELIDRAVLLAPDEAAVYFHRAEAHRLLDQPERATRAERIGRSSPVPARADGFATLSDPARDEVSLRDGATTDWLLRNSRTHLAEGRGDRAIEGLRLAVAAQPESIDLRLELSRTLARLGAFEQAGEEAERALALDGSRADSYAQLAEVLIRVGQFERAIEAFRRALDIDPELHETRGTLGTVLAETGRVDEGLELLRAASEALPGNADLRYNLAAALLQIGDENAAIAALVELTEMRPDFSPGYVLLGTLHAMDGRLDESVAALEHAVEIAPNDVDAHLELGRSLWESKRYAEAIDSFNQAAGRRPNDLEIARELAMALATSPDDSVRDGARALILAQRLCEQSQFQNPTDLETLAAAQAATGSYDVAGETAGRALTIVETALAGIDPGEATKRQVLDEFAAQLRAMQSRYRRGSS